MEILDYLFLVYENFSWFQWLTNVFVFGNILFVVLHIIDRLGDS